MTTIQIYCLATLTVLLSSCASNPNSVSIEGLSATFTVEKWKDDVYFLTLSGPGALRSYRESLNQPFDEKARQLCDGRDYVSNPFTEYFGYKAAGAFGSTNTHLGIQRLGRIACKVKPTSE